MPTAVEILNGCKSRQDFTSGRISRCIFLSFYTASLCLCACAQHSPVQVKMSKKQAEPPAEVEAPNVLEGLKQLYHNELKPVEEEYLFPSEFFRLLWFTVGVSGLFSSYLLAEHHRYFCTP